MRAYPPAGRFVVVPARLGTLAEGCVDPLVERLDVPFQGDVAPQAARVWRDATESFTPFPAFSPGSSVEMALSWFRQDFHGYGTCLRVRGCNHVLVRSDCGA